MSTHPSKHFFRHAAKGRFRVLQLFALLLAAASLTFVSSQGQAFYGRPGELPPAQDLSEAAQTKVKQAVEAQLRASPKLDERPVNALANDCLFAAQMVQRGDKRFSDYLNARGRAILSAATPVAGLPTWSRRSEDNDLKKCPNGGLDSFGDGTCDAPATPYAFQSGLAIACLARAGDLLGKPGYINGAQRGLDYWTGRASSPPECNGCIFYWSSGNEKDKGRYVRNTSLYLTLGASALARAGAVTKSLVSRGIATERYEREAGNRGYLSALDPVWKSKPAERDRTENHMASMAAILLGVNRLLGDPAALDLALWDYATWATCRNAACSSSSCSYWAGDANRCATTHTATHCSFRQIDRSARSACETLLNEVKSLNTAMLLAILSGD